MNPSTNLQEQEYETYRGLPPLAGLCSMARAVEADWAIDESVTRLKRLHYVLKRAYEVCTARITGEPIYELKTALSHHAYLCSEQVSALRQRVSEMREPPLGLDKVPHLGLQRLMDEVLASPTTEFLLLGLYRVVLPAIVEAAERLKVEAHPLADAPSVRLAKLMVFELNEVVEFGRQAIACLVSVDRNESYAAWTSMLRECLTSAGEIDGSRLDQQETPIAVPAPVFSATEHQLEKEPHRDPRFIDSYNAGVNPEAFLYDERFSSRDKTLMMYYKRIRELDVPEMMATILHEMPQRPWEFHREMIRQLWDEARHAMMGEVGFASLGIDWRTIPINFTWSRNLNLQLTAQERHGVLFFIEQGLMPRSGKRYEWEVGLASGSPLSALFQDFDWADEVLHAQIGRRWYVPQFKSLNEALDYGDRCWSKVLMHWEDYRRQGLTEHRNWWPQIYQAACAKWNVTPDTQALAFNETYQSRRADLKEI